MRNPKEAKELILSEWNKRMALVNNAKFRKRCVAIAKQVGITAEEWNTNRAALLLHFANVACGIEKSRF